MWAVKHAVQRLTTHLPLTQPLRSLGTAVLKQQPPQPINPPFSPLSKFLLGFVGGTTLAAFSLPSSTPATHCQDTAENLRILDSCPTLHQPYRVFPDPTHTGHIETVLASFLRVNPAVTYRRLLISAPDGGTVALDWQQPPSGEIQDPSAPILILIPGLTGGSGSNYVGHAAQAAHTAGYRVVVYNHRGCAGSPVNTGRLYSAGYTGDLRSAVSYLQQKFPGAPLAAVGWSVGANVLVNYLAEEGSSTPVKAAMSLCNPLDLTASDRNWSKGVAQAYSWHLARRMRTVYERNCALRKLAPQQYGVIHDLVLGAETVRDFDEAATIRMFGYSTVDEYYQAAGSGQRLGQVKVPLMCVQALDDPIAPREAIPYDTFKSNPNLILVTTPSGGHLGWFAGPGAPMGGPWTDQLMVEYLGTKLGH